MHKGDVYRPAMYADQGQMEQAIYNLLSNAFKYSHPYTRVKFDMRLDTNRENYIFEITNYGKMIPDTIGEMIFEYGYRVSSSDSNNGEGFGEGIGLWLSKRIAEAHGGKLELVENEPICDYNVPMLVLLEGIPSEWKEDGKYFHLRQPQWREDEADTKAYKTLEQVLECDEKLLENAVCSKINKFHLRYLAKAGRESLEEVVPDAFRDAWMSSVYWDELSKPTAKITFRLSIPQ